MCVWGGGVWLGENAIGVSSSVVSDLGKSSVAEGVWEWAQWLHHLSHS